MVQIRVKPPLVCGRNNTEPPFGSSVTYALVLTIIAHSEILAFLIIYMTYHNFLCFKSGYSFIVVPYKCASNGYLEY